MEIIIKCIPVQILPGMRKKGVDTDQHDSSRVAKVIIESNFHFLYDWSKDIL